MTAMSTTVAFRPRRVLATAAILVMAFGPLVASRDVARADGMPPVDEQPEREDVSSAPVPTDESSPPGTDETPPREDGSPEGDGSGAQEPREDEQSEGDGSGAEEPREDEESAPADDPARESAPRETPEPTVPAEEPSGEESSADEPSREEAPQGEAPGDPAAPPSTPSADREVSLVREGDLVVEKLVDADGDGVFADEEDARSATSDVTFRITLANVGEAALEIVSVVDQVGAETLDLLAEPACATLGDALAAGSSVTCDLTIERYLRTYASQPRSQLTNVVEAVATDGDVSIAASDDATVYNPNALVVSAAVDLANDADGDGVFTDDEEAPTPFGDVPVRIEVANTSPGAVVITELVGDWDGGVDLLATACPELDGMKLRGAGGGHDDGSEHDDGNHEVDGGHEDDGSHEDDGGHDGGADRPSSVVCLTTLADHAPEAGASRTDTVTVTLGKQHSPDRTASASDATTTWVAAVQEEPTPEPTPSEPSPQPTVPSDDATPAPGPTTPTPAVPSGETGTPDATSPEALAFTGFAIGPWAGAGLASFLLGLALLLATGRVGAEARARLPRRPAGEDR